MNNYKYIVMFPLPDPYRSEIIQLMKEIERITGVEAPCKNLPPHMTFHRPIQEIDEQTILNLTQSIALQVTKTRITVSSIFNFGKQFAVLPVHATRSVAALWVGLNDLLSKLPEYEHGLFDHENTLHITVAEKLSKVFDEVWKDIHFLPIKTMEIPVKKIEVCRKHIGGSMWERIATYSLS